MIGIDFNRVPQRNLQILHFLIASAFTFQVNPDILERWQVPQAHAKATIAAGDYSRLPHEAAYQACLAPNTIWQSCI